MVLPIIAVNRRLSDIDRRFEGSLLNEIVFLGQSQRPGPSFIPRLSRKSSFDWQYFRGARVSQPAGGCMILVKVHMPINWLSRRRAEKQCSDHRSPRRLSRYAALTESAYSLRWMNRMVTLCWGFIMATAKDAFWMTFNCVLFHPCTPERPSRPLKSDLYPFHRRHGGHGSHFHWCLAQLVSWCRPWSHVDPESEGRWISNCVLGHLCLLRWRHVLEDHRFCPPPGMGYKPSSAS